MRNPSGAWWCPSIASSAELAPPPGAAGLFGARLPLAQRYVELLAGPGIEWGLIGPRERPRLWDRHVLNCAVLGELVPESARIVDIGSGAGLPGLVLACLAPGLQVQLVEPLERRVRFLRHAVHVLDLAGQVEVVRARAGTLELTDAVAPVRWVTARAVAPLDRLVEWCVPLLGEDGALLALKGARARSEVESAAGTLRRYRASARIRPVGGVIVDPAVNVVVVQRGNGT